VNRRTPQESARRVADLSTAGLRPLIALDHDGTLSPIAARPEDAALADGARAAITRLARSCPVAIISGRSLDDLVRRFQGVPVTLVSEHGLRCRDLDGSIEQFAAAIDGRILARVRDALHDLLDGEPGWSIEDKGVTIAVHHRLVAGDRLEPTLTIVEDLLRDAGVGVIQAGHAVLELRQSGADKGLALRRLAQLHPGRRPVMVGDDTTDEPALAVAEELGGIGILVASAPRESAASVQLRDPDEVVRFLDLLADRFRQEPPAASGTASTSSTVDR